MRKPSNAKIQEFKDRQRSSLRLGMIQIQLKVKVGQKRNARRRRYHLQIFRLYARKVKLEIGCLEFTWKQWERISKAKGLRRISREALTDISTFDLKAAHKEIKAFLTKHKLLKLLNS